MDPDDKVCLCFNVTLRKIRTYLRVEDPAVASLLSECFGAGTGCQWCVPFLKHLHAQHQAGQVPDLKVSPEQYTKARLSFHKSGERDEHVVTDATKGATPDPAHGSATNDATSPHDGPGPHGA